MFGLFFCVMDAAWFRDLRGLVLTGFLDGLKIADGANNMWAFQDYGPAMRGPVPSVGWQAPVFWFPCFVAWLLKSVVMRYGGMKMYLRARPLMLGLIMGEFSMAVVWALVAWTFKMPAPFLSWP